MVSARPSLCCIQGQKTYAICDEEHRDGQLELTTGQTKLLLKTEQTGIANVD